MTIEIIIELVVLFLLKAIDNLLSTGKQILIQRHRPILASLSVVVSQIIFYRLISKVSASGGDLALIAVKLSDKFSKERTFVNVILSDDMQAMIDLRAFLIAHKITNLTTDGYTKDWSKSIAITAYADTREQSRLIDNYLNNSKSKFKRIIQNK